MQIKFKVTKWENHMECTRNIVWANKQKVSLILLVFQSKLIAEHEAEEEQWKGKTFSGFTNVHILGGIYAWLSF